MLWTAPPLRHQSATGWSREAIRHSLHQGGHLQRQIAPECNFGCVKQLSGSRSTGAFTAGDRDDVTAIDPVEDQLFGVRCPYRRPELVAKIVMEPLDDLEEIARRTSFVAQDDCPQAGGMDRVIMDSRSGATRNAELPRL